MSLQNIYWYANGMQTQLWHQHEAISPYADAQILPDKADAVLCSRSTGMARNNSLVF